MGFEHGPGTFPIWGRGGRVGTQGYSLSNVFDLIGWNLTPFSKLFVASQLPMDLSMPSVFQIQFLIYPINQLINQSINPFHLINFN